MPPFHVVIGADQLFVYTPAGGRPGSAFNPCAVNILNKLLQGFSGGLQLKTGKENGRRDWAFLPTSALSIKDNY